MDCSRRRADARRRPRRGAQRRRRRRPRDGRRLVRDDRARAQSRDDAVRKRPQDARVDSRRIVHDPGGLRRRTDARPRRQIPGSAQTARTPGHHFSPAGGQPPLRADAHPHKVELPVKRAPQCIHRRLRNGAHDHLRPHDRRHLRVLRSGHASCSLAGERRDGCLRAAPRLAFRQGPSPDPGKLSSRHPHALEPRGPARRRLAHLPIANHHNPALRHLPRGSRMLGGDSPRAFHRALPRADRPIGRRDLRQLRNRHAARRQLRPACLHELYRVRGENRRRRRRIRPCRGPSHARLGRGLRRRRRIRRRRFPRACRL